MSFRHAALRSSSILRQQYYLNAHSTSNYPLIFTRAYAKAGKGAKSTASLVPRSKQPITDPAAQEEYANAERKMTAAVDWLRKECASIETRANGRVTPDLLSSVRVKFPKDDHAFKLEEISTVGVRNASELVITVFEEEVGQFPLSFVNWLSLKHVERALYDAKLPGLSSFQKQDNRTLKIPVPKPTVEARQTLFATAERQAEDTRVQIRRHHQASLKKGKYEKHSIELEEFQKLTNRFVNNVDTILKGLKK
ncbi:ribosome recycling factor domain-containing protein [Lentinula boryana]|uniref:Ribosome recycling factor domain-containing protein n=1 Tax=Lentinula boryana TaxID=40481 RepID=A0ABQ8QMY5_9AGAR|nr:ribosome recycling factor domain-containing protein [Lentinula boryana]